MKYILKVLGIQNRILPNKYLTNISNTLFEILPLPAHQVGWIIGLG